MVVATSRKTRGGVTAVVRAHERSETWREFHCHWVQSHRDGGNLRKALYFVGGLADYMMRLPFCDVVHIHTSNFRAEQRKRLFARLAHWCGKRVIMHLHSSSPEFSVGGEHAELYRYSFTHAERVIVLSESWRREVIRAFPEIADRVCVLENPCVALPIPPDMHLPLPERYILFAGTLNGRKRYADLLRAFAQICECADCRDVHLVFAGNGELPQARRLAQQLGVTSRVHFLDWVDDPVRGYLFSHAAVYCLPSGAEGFPMGVLDAWAYGVPVVASAVGGLADVAVDGSNMLVVLPGDVDGIAAALRRALQPAQAARLRAGSAAMAAGRFAPEQVSRTLAQIYTGYKKSRSN